MYHEDSSRTREVPQPITTMKALLVTELDKPLVLVHDRPIPLPGPDQVQLKVSVASLNPHDEKSRTWGLFIKDNLPAVLAHDVVGTVTALGEAVTKFNVGDRIVAQAVIDGTHVQAGLQEYTIADTLAASKIPDGVSDDEAATIPTNAIASLFGIFNDLAIPAPWEPWAQEFDYANTKLLILGGGSNCGRFAVQLASLAGIGTIIVVGGNEAELRSYGATHVLNRHGGHDAVTARIREAVGEEDDLVYAFDAINTPEDQVMPLNAMSRHLKPTLTRLLPLGPVDAEKVVGKQAGWEVKDTFGSSQCVPELAEPFWNLLPDLLRTGKLRPTPNWTVEHGLDADKVDAVLDAYKDGKTVKKTNVHL